MSKKQKEVQIQVQSEAHWKDIMRAEPGVLVEVFSGQWGQCLCFKGIISRLYYDHMDTVKFYIVDAEQVESFAEYKGLPKPVYIAYKDGAQLATVEGVQGPKIERALVALSEAIGSN
eukprot:TRINITY_DN11362_c0_g1_i3.p1 TRINITY_DN11362_c0_g1~~TRINITY_DN11362_c0_g1_i3.p1  ORF type:complete len:117 (-),score=27.18 TRINITY_DN11362_c0_g1_i3:403-753(-)